MKRRDLLRHLQAHGCRLDREGAKHSLWLNPATGAVETVPRHVEIGKHLARKICKATDKVETGSTDLWQPGEAL